MSDESRALIYMEIKELVIRAGYGAEVDWQAEVDFERVTEAEFLREAAWVILSTGFREAVLRKCFEGISKAFLGWRNARAIDGRRRECKEAALAVFQNRRKIEAISDIVRKVAEEGIDCIKREIRLNGVEYLRQLPYIGPVTAYHLAKNLGLDVVKADRHLVRMARSAGYETPFEMCAEVAGTVGDSVAVVDVVLWRYATLSKDYDVFQSEVGTGWTVERGQANRVVGGGRRMPWDGCEGRIWRE